MTSTLWRVQCPGCPQIVTAPAGASLSCSRCAHRIDVPARPGNVLARPSAISPEAAYSSRLKPPSHRLAATACVAAGVMSLLLFGKALSLLDRTNPVAAGCLAGVLLVATFAIAVSLPSLAGRRWFWHSFWVAVPVALVAIVLAIIAANWTEIRGGSLPILLVPLFVIAVGALVPVLLGLLILGLVFFIRWAIRLGRTTNPAERERRYSHRFAACFIFGWGLAFGLALAAVFSFTTL